MADEIRFHERLLRLSDWVDGDPNIDEDLWPLPKQALTEIKRLRCWCDRLATALGDSYPSHPAYEAWEEDRRG